ncbi:MAG TPA: transporter associated domain-containing protein, partial [Planctomycetota bacterium]|nr:transporter associated domain-containing protein [Planctomycetota bacterium]
VDGSNRAEVVDAALERRLAWVPVSDESPDTVLGRVKVRDLLRFPDRPVAQLVAPVRFVPEVANALDVLRALRDGRTAEAVVVDEWGGTAGFVTLEDLLEQVVGDLRVEGEERQPVAVPLGEGVYRVPGRLSVRDWNDRFGVRVVPTDFETVGGLVTHELGRIPRVGDVVRVGDLELEVHEVRGRRVLSVDVQVTRVQTVEAAP